MHPLLRDIVDLHIHTAPDVRPRRFDDLAMAFLAKDCGARAIVLKSHHNSTVERAVMADQQVSGIRVFGGVVLNRTVGGLNPSAVETAVQIGAKIIWMPTLEARNHLLIHPSGMCPEETGITLIQDGVLRPEMTTILEIIRDAGVVLGTGHVGKKEMNLLLQKAHDMGIGKLLINHPEHRVTNLSLDEQRELLERFPVLFERCYAQPAGGGKYRENLEDNLAAIRSLGEQSTVIASDAGQVESLPWNESMTKYVRYLLDNGVGEEAIRNMISIRPGALLGLHEGGN